MPETITSPVMIKDVPIELKYQRAICVLKSASI